MNFPSARTSLHDLGDLPSTDGVFPASYLSSALASGFRAAEKILSSRRLTAISRWVFFQLLLATPLVPPLPDVDFLFVRFQGADVLEETPFPELLGSAWFLLSRSPRVISLPTSLIEKLGDEPLSLTLPVRLPWSGVPPEFSRIIRRLDSNPTCSQFFSFSPAQSSRLPFCGESFRFRSNSRHQGPSHPPVSPPPPTLFPSRSSGTQRTRQPST